MDLNEFFSTLPPDVVSGDKVSLPENVLRRILKFAGLRRSDVFYHLGCGDGKGVAMAAIEFGVKKAIGVELDNEVASSAAKHVAGISHANIVNADMTKVDISDATAVLLWSGDSSLVKRMERRFVKGLRKGAGVITIWSPLGMNLPDKMDFPFFVCRKPFRRAKSIREQIKAIYGNECIDFTAAWLLADRYIDQMQSMQAEYRRFLNIIQSVVIWVNAWNMGIACEEKIPPPVDAYIGILKTFFNIDLSSMISDTEQASKKSRRLARSI